MSAFVHGAGFRICGSVTRRFVSQSGRFASLTLDVQAHPRAKKIELRAFDGAIVDEIGKLAPGATIEVTGRIDAEGLKDKAKNDVKVDGYVKWVFPLTVTAVKVEGSSRAPAAKGEPPKPAPAERSFDDGDDGRFKDDKDVPF